MPKIVASFKDRKSKVSAFFSDVKQSRDRNAAGSGESILHSQKMLMPNY
jgi:hypothetical protein